MIMTVCESQGEIGGYFSEVIVYKELIYQMCAFRSVNLTYANDVYVLGETDLLVYNHYDFENPLYYYMEINGSPVFENSFSYGKLDDDELYTVPMDSIPFSSQLQYLVGLGVHDVSVTVFSELNATAVYCESKIKFVELVSQISLGEEKKKKTINVNRTEIKFKRYYGKIFTLTLNWRLILAKYLH